MGLNDMVVNIDEANANVSTETDLIAQITIALEGKAGGKTDPVLQDKTVIPTANTQTITADSGYDGLSSVVINGIPDTFSELNFEIIGGTTEPTNPKENTIWVNTSAEITGWYFYAEQPENMVEGEVWFATGDSSEAAFEALKKNGIRIYPIECKQMISGELKGVAFTIYQNGAWVEWWNGQLYDSGNEYTFVTGGWQARGLKVVSKYDAAAPTIAKGSNNVTISQSSYACGGVYEIVKDFDLTEFNTLTFNVAAGSETGILGLIVYDRSITSTGNDNSTPFSKTLAYKQLKLGDNGSFNIDVSGVNKAACIGIAVYNSVASKTPYVTMKKAFVS
jgi:hypothetical protein